MRLLLEPTGRLETMGGRQFRVFVGKAEGNLPVEMIGMFRFGSPEHMQRFVDSLPPQEGAPGTLIGAAQLNTGVDERPTLYHAMREALHRKIAWERNIPPIDDAHAEIRDQRIAAYEIALGLLEQLRARTR